MASHRSFTFQNFLRGIPLDLLQKFFDRVCPGWIRLDQFETSMHGLQHSLMPVLDLTALEEFLEQPAHAEAKARSLEDLQRINDITVEETPDGSSLVIQGLQEADPSFPLEGSVQVLAMQLYLEFPEEFEVAWSRYLLHSGDTKVASYPVVFSLLLFDDGTIENLKEDLERFLATQGRGQNVIVRRHQDNAEASLFIQRGEKMRSVAYWKDGKIEIAPLRLATEDHVVYRREEHKLIIRSRYSRHSEFLLGAVAFHVGGNGGLARTAVDTPMYSLVPFQQGTFDYSGEGDIVKVIVTGAKTRSNNPNSTINYATSKDLLEDMARPGYNGTRLDDGNLLSIRLNFLIRTARANPLKVSVTITPPNHSQIKQAKYAPLIENFLKQQGVLLG
ncbi:MAG: hypothetical protein ACE5Q6_05535 [Dehalococcoidia bacterium]